MQDLLVAGLKINYRGEKLDAGFAGGCSQELFPEWKRRMQDLL